MGPMDGALFRIVLYLLPLPKVLFTSRKKLTSLSCQTLEQAVQGDGWVPIPGGVQKTWRCGNLGYGLVGMVVLGGWLDLMILEIFSNLTDSVILWLNCYRRKNMWAGNPAFFLKEYLRIIQKYRFHCDSVHGD